MSEVNFIAPNQAEERNFLILLTNPNKFYVFKLWYIFHLSPENMDREFRSGRNSLLSSPHYMVSVSKSCMKIQLKIFLDDFIG